MKNGSKRPITHEGLSQANRLVGVGVNFPKTGRYGQKLVIWKNIIKDLF